MKGKNLILIGILLIASAMIIAPTMAASTATITGNPAKIITVSVTGGISDWAFTSGTDNVDASSVKLTVSSNSPNWYVSVVDAMDGTKTTGSEGKMADFTTASSTYNTLTLGSALKVKGATGTGYTGTEKTLSGTAQAIVTGASDSTAAGTFTDTAVTFTQPVAITDSVLGSGHAYRIIVTFAGTTP